MCMFSDGPINNSFLLPDPSFPRKMMSVLVPAEASHTFLPRRFHTRFLEHHKLEISVKSIIFSQIFYLSCTNLMDIILTEMICDIAKHFYLPFS